MLARRFAHVSERDEGIWGKGELDSDEEKRSEDWSLDKHMGKYAANEKQNNLCDNLRHVLLIASLNRPKPLTDQETESGGNDTAFYWTCPIQKKCCRNMYFCIYLFLFVFIFKENCLNKIHLLGVCVCVSVCVCGGGGGVHIMYSCFQFFLAFMF